MEKSLLCLLIENNLPKCMWYPAIMKWSHCTCIQNYDFSNFYPTKLCCPEWPPTINKFLVVLQQVKLSLFLAMITFLSWLESGKFITFCIRKLLPSISIRMKPQPMPSKLALGHVLSCWVTEDNHTFPTSGCAFCVLVIGEMIKICSRAPYTLNGYTISTTAFCNNFHYSYYLHKHYTLSIF